MTATYISILLATGAGAGFASGLLGVGGGFIMVPVMYSVIGAMGFPDIAMKVALGTSLLVILPTAMSGAWRHNKKKAVRWKTALVLGLCGLGGGLAGSTLATHLPERALKAGFGGLVLAMAIWMGLGMMPELAKQRTEPKDNPRLLPALGFPIGMVSGLTGLGGGALIVPALVLALDFPMHLAIGTSVTAIILTSLGGIIGYIIHGIGVSGLLPYSIGYINLPIWLCLAGMSVPLAQLGAKTAHALPAKQLRYIFIALMVYIGLRMIGVFSWLGLPI
ncbi:MAG: sulfite exporter TauE/SafE family protein [Dehalococcoidia bacterium]|nr:sulfite exporter TauE/SafE family protein [Dehalococcoidia bacterium]